MKKKAPLHRTGDNVWLASEGLIEHSRRLTVAGVVTAVSPHHNGCTYEVRAMNQDKFGGCWTDESVFLSEEEGKARGRRIAADMIAREIERQRLVVSRVTDVLAFNT